METIIKDLKDAYDTLEELWDSLESMFDETELDDVSLAMRSIEKAINYLEKQNG